MRILVCVKRVPAPGSRINVTEDGLSVDTAHLGFTTSPHEECALEEAAQLIEEHGGSVCVLTVGPAEAEEQLRYAASVGGTDFSLVLNDTGQDWDPQQTAASIGEAVHQLEAETGIFDLILFGNESADAGGYQVGVRVAVALNRPIVNGIKGIEVEGESLAASREVDGGIEVYSLPTPAVLGIKEGINLPRYPTMKGRLASKKAEIQTTETKVPAGTQRLVRLHRPEEKVTETEVLGDGPEAATKIVDLLDELGVL
ncbi:MAG: electron transfer flavoprotein subunit alpha [Acidimicrobiaceae bacterium]|nr:electron transfer flavoprotein subunit alpha [Acidimicrobiaceae bacterium]|tara:strand:+ start:2815 stop:3582 length:768 start_codon:yes stop_codon:yes gene_type:complete